MARIKTAPGQLDLFGGVPYIHPEQITLPTSPHQEGRLDDDDLTDLCPVCPGGHCDRLHCPLGDVGEESPPASAPATQITPTEPGPIPGQDGPRADGPNGAGARCPGGDHSPTAAPITPKVGNGGPVVGKVVLLGWVAMAIAWVDSVQVVSVGSLVWTSNRAGRMFSSGRVTKVAAIFTIPTDEMVKADKRCKGIPYLLDVLVTVKLERLPCYTVPLSRLYLPKGDPPPEPADAPETDQPDPMSGHDGPVILYRDRGPSSPESGRWWYAGVMAIAPEPLPVAGASDARRHGDARWFPAGYDPNTRQWS